ncbi:MAG TPA: ATP-binding cassette domain-containing protein [Dissulfurispiraceae bacterium]|nr:ATP-binding cassette domain-containing protein [Dissulfurispiraceae bacterium]
MIKFDHVCFSYGERTVLNDASFFIDSGERVAILGGSGEGKTTILKLILGLLRPDSGRILIDGEDLTDKAESELRDVRMKFSIVFQEGALFDSLNVRENVAFCLREYSKLSEEEIDRRVRELLRLVGVEHAIELMPDELSGGMHRRVAIARSLAVCDPAMFLYDEPTSGLDPVNADTICRLIIDLSKNEKGFIIVTHKVYDAMRVAGRFMFLKGGSVVFDGNRELLLQASIPDINIFMSELRGVCDN